MRFSIITLAALAVPYVAAASVPALPKRGCTNETVISKETHESGVVITKLQCHDERGLSADDTSIEKRSGVLELCPESTGCSTTCYAGNGGPNQNDCMTIQNVISSGGDIEIGTGQVWSYVWNSCEARFFNQADSSGPTIDICPSAFAGTIQWLAGDCNGANGAQGGKCLSFTTTPNTGGPLWFIDVIHS